MSSRKERSMDNGGITFSARRLSSSDSKDMADQGGGGDDGSLQQQYSIPRFVSKVYYRLGLLCASHPRFVLILAFIVIVWSCFPLLSLPIYSTRPQINVQPFPTFVRENHHGPHLASIDSSKDNKFKTAPLDNESTIVTSDNSTIFSQKRQFSEEIPKWKINQRPVAYVQQIIMKSMVYPYKKDDLVRTDAFRGPLASAFKLHLEDLTVFQDVNSGLDMDHICLRTDGLSARYRSMDILPDYGCMILSPANLWARDSESFQMDPNLIATVFNYQRSREGYSSMTDLMFGMRQRDSGITSYPIRNRQRVISYAITIALREYKPQFINALKQHLVKLYPLHQNLTLDEAGNVDLDNKTPDIDKKETVPNNHEMKTNTETIKDSKEEIAHIYYPPIGRYYVEMVPLFITLLILFLYVYFSCNKIELVRRKFGFAASAVVTVCVAICMSLGLSGISLNINTKVYFVPYLVAFISLENMLVVTKSIIESPAHLDVKIRVAQGLGKEGWNMTKNLFCEITILTAVFVVVGFMDPTTQEFCTLAVMGLLADFFLQIFFFVTLLSMDMNHMALSDVLPKPHYGTTGRQSSRKQIASDSKMFQRPISGPGLVRNNSNSGTNVMAPMYNGFAHENNTKAPEAKRVKLFNFWARKRIIQRVFVLFMLGWISAFIYQAGLIEIVLKSAQHDPFLGPHVQLPEEQPENNETNDAQKPNENTINGNVNHEEHVTGKEEVDMLLISKFRNLTFLQGSSKNLSAMIHSKTTQNQDAMNEKSTNANQPPHSASPGKILGKLLHNPEYNPWKRLPYTHWPMLFGLYNMTLYGQYITILPPIHLSMTISPESAKSLRHPKEYDPKMNNEDRATETKINGGSEDIDLEEDLDDFDPDTPELSPFVPTSPGELILALVLATPSLLFTAYLCVTLYRCICPKNYAEWRSSWHNDRKTNHSENVANAEGGGSYHENDIYTQMVREVSLIALEGHRHEIEYLVADCSLVISMCLGGAINIWDFYSGDKIAEMDRARYSKQTASRNLISVNGINEARNLQHAPNQFSTQNGREFRDSFCSSEVDSQEISCNQSLDNSFPTKEKCYNRFSRESSTENYFPLNAHSYEDNEQSQHASTETLPIEKTENIKSKTSLPDFSHTINTNFAMVNNDISKKVEDSSKNKIIGHEDDTVHDKKMERCNSAFSFSKFEKLLANHKENEDIMSTSLPNCTQDEESLLKRTYLPRGKERISTFDHKLIPSSVWAMDVSDGLLVLGCSNGRIELWESFSGKLKCSHDDWTGNGINQIKLVTHNRRLLCVVARLAGFLEFLEISSSNNKSSKSISESSNDIRSGPESKTSSIFSFASSTQRATNNINGAARRYHIRNNSEASPDGFETLNIESESEFRISSLHSTRAHQQPITCLVVEVGIVVTGSQDHTLRIFRLSDYLGVYTLHGHCGPITSIFIDNIDGTQPLAAGSGSQDGMLCVWDLSTGACVYSIQAHDGAILSLAHSPSYVVSMGSDEKLCVWERFHGHLINTINLVGGPYCHDLIMLSHNLVVTGTQGQLVVWDARLPDPVRRVRLGSTDKTHSIRMMQHLGDTIACNYGNQMRLVRFPMLFDKVD